MRIGFRVVAPYAVQAADGALSGLEYELVTVAAAAGGLDIRPDVAPFGRLPENFRRAQIDGFVPASPAMNLPGCMSQTVLTYRNVAFSLRENNLAIAAVSDLFRHDVIAFQNAALVLGTEMAAVARDNPDYREVANQMLQVRALYSGRTDVVIADRRIFRYLSLSSDSGIDIGRALTEHALFPPTPYAVAFRQPESCAAFNDGLERIMRDGRYDAILQHWERTLQAAQQAVPIRVPG